MLERLSISRTTQEKNMAHPRHHENAQPGDLFRERRTGEIIQVESVTHDFRGNKAVCVYTYPGEEPIPARLLDSNYDAVELKD